MDQKWTEDKFMQLSGTCWQACLLYSAVKLDIFSMLNDKPLTEDEVVKRLKADGRGTRIVLNALVADGLLTRMGTAYVNTEVSKKYLVKDSENYLGHRLLHHHYLLESWNQVDKAVLTGKPVGGRDIFSQDEKRREAFLMSMFSNAQRIAPLMAEQIDLSQARLLMDMGGGPGTYAICFCQKNTNLKAVIYDLPTTKPYAEKTVKKFNLSERISFHGGNYFKDPVPAGFDVVWLSHVLHSAGPEEAEVMLQKAAEALKPGGMLLMHDFYLNETMDGPFFPALFAVNMLVRTEKGQTYSEQQVRALLEKRAFKNIERLKISLPTESGVIRAIKS